MSNPDLLFSLINISVMPAWVLLIFAPRWSLTRRVVHSVFYPMLLGIFYLSLMIYMSAYGPENTEGGFTSIAGVQALFAEPLGLVIGWAHYLVFDLFVGAWVARDALRKNLNHLLVAPCLLFTYVLGPIGLLLYIILRKVTKKGGWTLFES